MKTTHASGSRGIVVCIFSLFASLFSPTQALGECSRDDAMNKMMAIDYYAGLAQKGYNDALRARDERELERIGQSVRRFVEPKLAISDLISSGKYSQACAEADKAAKQLGIDLKKAKFLTMEQLAKTGGRKQGGKCDMAQAAAKAGEIWRKFADAMANGTMSYDDSLRFGSRMEEIGAVMHYDPSEACERLESLGKEWQFK